MSKRRITNTKDLKFEPFDRYGSVIPGMSWHKISYDDKTSIGTYVSKLEPGTKTIPHTHTGYEEFFVLEGELIDSDGTVFKTGDFVTFEPGSVHGSHTEIGCLLLTFMRGVNKPLDSNLEN
jgi:anti-sigma factor ChrR (cupin superfamily)